MGYSTFMENGYKPSKFDELKFEIASAGRKELVYIVVTEANNNSLETISEYLQKAITIKSRAICQVNGTIDLVIKGEEEAKKAALELHKQTNQYVGVVKYEGQNMGKLYLDIKEAIQAAEEKKMPYFFYDPKIDSLQAKLEARLKATEKKSE